MKPRIFIGSSTERLEIAYSIQENLDHDAQVTVWTQGIFKLSTSVLDSLITSLDKFDFAVFVFHPDDVTQIRNATFDTIRDNLIFELGLFIGRIGKERIFFLIPRNIEKLHLPTDLLGIIPGTYDNSREDKNLLASLGPFCNQIRKVVKEFVYENIEDIANEPQHIKEIVIERRAGWEYLFAASVLEYRLIDINQSYRDIESGILIKKLNNFTGQQFFEWFQNSLDNFRNLLRLFDKCMEELTKSFGPPGVSGKPIEIKNAIDRFIQLCKELLNWEYELESINPPEELINVKSLLRGWTKGMLVDELNRFHKETKEFIENLSENSGKASIVLTPKIPATLGTVTEEFKIYLLNHRS